MIRSRAATSALLGMVLLPGLASSVLARTWHILPDGTGDAPTIQAAMDSSAAADTVSLACGNYFEYAIEIRPGVTLRSESGTAGCVTIDAQDHAHALALHSPSGQQTLIQGITIRGAHYGSISDGGGLVVTGQGASVTVEDCVFDNNEGFFDGPGGGGMSVHDTTVRLVRCTFVQNWSRNGGGIYLDSVPTTTLLDCQFQGNLAGSSGGGLFLSSGSLAISNCEFVSNFASNDAGAIGISESAAKIDNTMFLGNRTEPGGFYAGRGAAVYGNNQSSLQLEDCTFEDNYTVMWGAAVFSNGGTVSIKGCDFLRNDAGLGGSLYLKGWTVFEVERCLFVENTAVEKGGAVYVSSSPGSVSRCTFVGSAAASGGHFYMNSWTAAQSFDHCVMAFAGSGGALGCVQLADPPAISCSNLYGNGDGDWSDCIADQAGIDGNFSADPRFCDAAGGNFTIRSDSPCAPPGVTGCGLIGALPVGCGPVAVEAMSWGQVKGRYR